MGYSSARQVAKRYDYLPFGEELFAGTGPRTEALKYLAGSATDNLAHKFTGKERDAETGLDYFGARYFSGAQGRFTSPDPVHILKQKLLDPQQWNMYAYVRNNPLRFRDPTGKYICNGTQQQCDAFDKALQNALKSKNAGDVRGAQAYGQRGKNNGVYVGFADELKKDRGGSVSRRDTGIEADPNSKNGLRATVNVTIKSSLAGSEETIVHEGSHVADRQDCVNAIGPDGNMDRAKAFNITLGESEVRAYLLSIGYAQRRAEHLPELQS